MRDSRADLPPGVPTGPGAPVAPETEWDGTSDDLLGAWLQLIAAGYRSPDAALREDLATGRFVALAAALAGVLELPAPTFDLDGVTTAQSWATLQARYVRLFVTAPGGVVAPPYVGLVHDGILRGPGAATLERRLREAGVVPQPSWKDLGDHVAAVAEAGQLLLDAGHAELARSLVDDSLLAWLERYAAPLAEADPGFYGPLSLFLHDAGPRLQAERGPS